MSEIISRYFLMMAFVMIGGFTGMWWIAALALPTFLSAITGFCFIKYLLKR